MEWFHKGNFGNSPKEENERIKVRKLFETLPELEEPCRDPKGLIETVSGLYNCTGLNIAHDSMSHRTAKAGYEKLSGGLIFIQEYFSYIEHNHFCEKVMTTCLTDKLAECFFGIVTERCPALEATRISSNLPKY